MILQVCSVCQETPSHRLLGTLAVRSRETRDLATIGLGTYHNTHKVQFTQLIVPPQNGKIIPLILILRVQQDLNRIIRRRIRGVNTTTEELEHPKRRPFLVI